MTHEYYSDDSYDYSSSDSDFENDDSFILSQEDWEDWNSEELLNVWMSIVEYHEEWYIPLRRTFNQFCDFVYQADDEKETLTPEIQAVKEHPFVKGLDWNYFFSLSYK